MPLDIIDFTLLIKWNILSISFLVLLPTYLFCVWIFCIFFHLLNLFSFTVCDAHLKRVFFFIMLLISEFFPPNFLIYVCMLHVTPFLCCSFMLIFALSGLHIYQFDYLVYWYKISESLFDSFFSIKKRFWLVLITSFYVVIYKLLFLYIW